MALYASTMSHYSRFVYKEHEDGTHATLYFNMTDYPVVMLGSVVIALLCFRDSGVVH